MVYLATNAQQMFRTSLQKEIMFVKDVQIIPQDVEEHLLVFVELASVQLIMVRLVQLVQLIYLTNRQWEIALVYLALIILQVAEEFPLVHVWLVMLDLHLLILLARFVQKENSRPSLETQLVLIFVQQGQ